MKWTTQKVLSTAETCSGPWRKGQTKNKLGFLSNQFGFYLKLLQWNIIYIQTNMRHYCCKKIKVKVMGLTVMLLSYSTSFGGGFRLRACVCVWRHAVVVLRADYDTHFGHLVHTINNDHVSSFNCIRACVFARVGISLLSVALDSVPGSECLFWFGRVKRKCSLNIQGKKKACLSI